MPHKKKTAKRKKASKKATSKKPRKIASKKTSDKSARRGRGRPKSSVSDSKASRFSDDVERNLRLAKVARLRFVQRWTIEEIAGNLGVSTRTIERDLQAIRKEQRAKAKKELAHIVDDVRDDLRLSFDEKIKLLWQEYFRLAVSKTGKPLTLGLQKRYQVMALIKQITETENSYVDQLRKIGIIGPTLGPGEEDGDLLLVQIRERFAKRKKDNSASGGTVASGGGADDKPSGDPK